MNVFRGGRRAAPLCIALLAAGCAEERASSPEEPAKIAQIRQEVENDIGDLDFILRQIEIAEDHAAGTPLRELIPSPLLHYGLRTVDGRENNIIRGQESFGSSDRLFPRLTTPFLRAGDPVAIDMDGPGGQQLGDPTSYAQTSGLVFDAHPRIVSNLIVDQTNNNPAAVAAAARVEDSVETPTGDPQNPAETHFFIPNVAPDEGLSAPYNSWFTLFGQFFDHGLDLVAKGGSGTLIVPLQTDDPLYQPGSPLNFMQLTRATNRPGPDGLLGTDDDVHEHLNHTTAFVDQNQTYTSHAAHQLFLREYVLDAWGRPVSNGRLLEGARGGLASWGEVKAQARALLGIELRDADVLSGPLVETDPYGRFVRGPNGLPLLVTTTGSRVEGSRASPRNTDGIVRTGHAFVEDIAHTAVPTGRVPDADAAIGGAGPGTYDDELLAAHLCAGDGRANENIGLTAVHFIFHAEHNRLVEHVKELVLATNNPGYIANWLLPGANQADGIDPLEWNGERIFQAARFGTEMQYQHLVFEEFARKVQPEVNVFGTYDASIDATMVAEFAHTVYRFGHSMLTETMARTNADGTSADLGLIEAFLNPVAFGTNSATGEEYATAAEAAGAIIRGMTRQVGNEVDEFVTDALRNNLLGLPLDLPTINLLRGRDTGVPPLNDARRIFFDASGNSAVRPYANWVDYGLALRNPESLVNFVAAYGTHPSIVSATTLDERRAAAQALVGPPGDFDFMNATGAWAGVETGINLVDFWVGGLAEKQMIFGGLLGPTFNFVFEVQLEKLQDGDRLYYLARTEGLNFLTQLEENSFAELVMRNTDVKHLPFDIFSHPTFIFELANLGTSGAIVDDPATPDVDESAELIRMPDGTVRYTGEEHVVFGGTPGNDRMWGSEGDDTFWGDEGDDWIEGGDGNDSINGGDGDDIITDIFGIDNIKGGRGNDVISAGPGLGDLILAGAGHDFVVGGADPKEVFSGQGNDFVHAGDSADTVFGGEGDDWIEGGDQNDLLQGDNGERFQASPIIGNDVILGQGGDDDYDAESGDDIMVSDGGIERHEGMLGFDWVTYKGAIEPADADLDRTALVPPDVDDIRDRFDEVEGLSGWDLDDLLVGDDETSAELLDPNEESGGLNNALNTSAQIGLISGLQELLGPGVTSFAGGNIILGGNGSDRIAGRGGDDILDGDRWLNVRISIRDAADPSIEIGTADSMKARITGKSGALAGTPDTLTLSAAMFAGTVNPGNLRIVREILTPAPGAFVDTAMFQDVSANYVMTRNPGGSIRVAHIGGDQADGVDTLHNIEMLEFTDGTIPAASITLPTDVVPPAAVTGLTAVAGDATVTLTWSNPADAASVLVLRSTVGAAAAPVETDEQEIVEDGLVNTFGDEEVLNGTTYFYTVFVRDAAGNTSPARSTSATPVDPDTTPPAAPTNFVQTAGNAQVSLTWTNPPGTAGLLLLRSTTRFASSSADTAGQVTLVGGTSTSYLDTGLTNGTTYFYTLFARDAAGNFSAPATVNATPQAPPGGGGIPTDPGGCGCTSGASGADLLAGFLGLAALARVSRRRT